MDSCVVSSSVLAFASSTLALLALQKTLENKSTSTPTKANPETNTPAEKVDTVITKSKENAKYKGVFVELILPVSVVGSAEVLVNNDCILNKAVKDAGESISVYILEESPECVINSAEMFHYMSDVYSQLWDEMVSQNKMHLSCSVVCDAIEVPFSSPASLYSQDNVQAIYTTNVTPIRESAMNSIRASAGIEEALVFEECPQPIVPEVSCKGKAPPSNFFLDGGRTGGTPRALPVFGTVALGGTFDRLHNGHRKLLTLGAGLCRDVLVVGITGDEMLRKKSLASMIFPYEERAKAVVDFLALIKPSLQVNVFQLTDPYGPTITDPSIEALVVSSETLGGVRKINELRRERESDGVTFPPLAGLVVRREDVSILSSTFIREREREQADQEQPVV